MHQGWSLLQQRLVTQVHHIRPRPEVVRDPRYVVAQLESLLVHPSLAKSAVVYSAARSDRDERDPSPASRQASTKPSPPS